MILSESVTKDENMNIKQSAKTKKTKTKEPTKITLVAFVLFTSLSLWQKRHANHFRFSHYLVQR